MAKKKRNKKKINAPKSQSINNKSSFQPFLTLLVGFIGAVFAAIFVTYFPLTKPAIKICEAKPNTPEMRSLDVDQINTYIQVALNVCVANRGLTDGYIDKIYAKQATLGFFAEAEIVKIDRSPIKWNEKKQANIECIVKIPNYVVEKVSNKEDKSSEQIRLEFYDNCGGHVGDMELAFYITKKVNRK